MSEETPIWRQAIKDEQHPLHRAAWLLFSQNFNLKYAEQVLAPQKEEVITFCNLILDTDELYNGETLGSGNAPINAVALLASWKVEEAIPRFIRILDEEDWESGIYGATADAIAAFGSAIVEPLLALVAKKDNDDEVISAIAGTLSDAAPGDPRTIAFIRKAFDNSKENFEIAYMAENILTGDPEGGVKWLEDRLRTRKYNKDLRKRIESYIVDAKAGKFQEFNRQ